MKVNTARAGPCYYLNVAAGEALSHLKKSSRGLMTM
jgi:hypothetical protein